MLSLTYISFSIVFWVYFFLPLLFNVPLKLFQAAVTVKFTYGGTDKGSLIPFLTSNFGFFCSFFSFLQYNIIELKVSPHVLRIYQQPDFILLLLRALFSPLTGYQQYQDRTVAEPNN